jgi:hypothetical protein
MKAQIFGTVPKRGYRRDFSRIELAEALNGMDENVFTTRISSFGYTRDQRKRAMEAGESAIIREFENMQIEKETE